MVGKRVKISFLRKTDGKTKIINEYRVKVKALGLCVLNFDESLRDGDFLEIRYETEKEKFRAWYSLEFPKRDSEDHDTTVITKNSNQEKDSLI